MWLLGPSRDTFVYEGKSVEDWSLQLFGAPSQSDRDAAADAFKQMGPIAVPKLVKQLRTRDPLFRRQVWTIGLSLPRKVRSKVAGQIKPPVAAVRRAAAARALAVIGPAAAPAVPALSKAIRDAEPQVSLDAACALGQIGEASVPELIRALADNHGSVRHMAAFSLGVIGPAAAPAIPALIELLPDKEPYVRNASANALFNTGAPGHQAVMEALTNRNADIRQGAAFVVTGFNLPLQELVPPLLQMMSDTEPNCRVEAVKSTFRLRILNLALMKGVTSALKDPCLEVRIAVIQGFAGAGGKARMAVPALIECLDDPSSQIRIDAARCLGNIGTQAAPATPALARLAGEQNPALRTAATNAIARINVRQESEPPNGPQ